MDTQQSINWFEEFADSPNAKVTSVLLGTPGYRPYQDDVGDDVVFADGQLRGTWTIQSTDAVQLPSMLAVHGPTLSLVSSSGTKTDIGSVDNDSKPVYFAEGNAEILICSANRLYRYVKATQALTGPLTFTTSGDPVIAHAVAFISGYFLSAGHTDVNLASQIQYSSVETCVFADADYFSAEFNPDLVRWISTHNLQLFAWGESSVQIFAPTGDSNNPFAPITGGFIHHGLAAFRSVAIAGQSQFWLGSDQERGGLTVYRTIGWDARRASDHGIEARLTEMVSIYGMAAVKDAIAWSYTDNGHAFYVLMISQAKTTLAYDVLTNKWHERRYWNKTLGEWEADLAWCHTFFNGKHLVGDRRSGLSSGGLYEMSMDLPDHDVIDGQTEIRRVRIGPHFAGPNHERLSFSDLELEFERGLAATTGQGSGPIAMVSFSDDGGKTYGLEYQLSVGQIGEYRKRCRLLRCGSAYDRVPMVVVSDPIRWRMVSAYWNVSAN